MQAAAKPTHLRMGAIGPDDAAGTVRLLNPLFGTKLPGRLAGSPSRNPPPRVLPLATDGNVAPPGSTKDLLKVTPAASKPNGVGGSGTSPRAARVSSPSLVVEDVAKTRGESEAAGA